MDYRLDTPYKRPLDEEPSWAANLLQQVRNLRVGDVAIELEITGGSPVLGWLEGADGGAVLVAGAMNREVRRVPSDRIVSFTLLNDEPPLDRSDELRG